MAPSKCGVTTTMEAVAKYVFIIKYCCTKHQYICITGVLTVPPKSAISQGEKMFVIIYAVPTDGQ